MADASLDDFFAKKDKTKKKSKSKFTPNDILAQGEEGLKKSKKKKEKKKEKENIETENNTDKIQVEKKEEEEWVDFEQEEEKDYSGLRIASLQISKEDGDKDKEQNDEDGSEEDDGEQSDDKKEKRDKTSDGPWNKGNAQPSYEREPVSHQKQEDLIPAGAVSGGKYVPPSRRGIDGSAMPLRTGGGRKSKKEAPNLRSESDFPTLGGGPVSSEGRFEEVRGSGRQKEDPTKKMQQLELGNKFGALSN